MSNKQFHIVSEMFDDEAKVRKVLAALNSMQVEKNKVYFNLMTVELPE